MRLADVEALVGVPYLQHTCDCADFVVLVQRQLFGRAVQLPNGRREAWWARPPLASCRGRMGPRWPCQRTVTWC